MHVLRTDKPVKPLRHVLSLVPTSCGLANLELLEVRTCGLWSVEFEQTRLSYGSWLGKYLGISRGNECNGAVWSFDARAIYLHNAGNHRCTNKPASHIDSSRSDDRE
ncbi:hypothetical protein AVEN_35998-1 [Araneus ventricosus]|uniref:Uncharacterized protein n=1 Tax=Araneus ventricosus TaxID=182803 RepID=A0A4Y2PH03_ARAVE|nr:hypothetical protein AVEN_35998-1 [Araneus ventricosus]